MWFEIGGTLFVIFVILWWIKTRNDIMDIMKVKN